MDSALRKAIWETISTDPIIMAAPATVTIARGKVSPKALTKHVNVIISDEGFTDVIGLHGAVVDAQIEFRIVGWDQERRASLVADRIDLLMLRPYSIYVTEEDMTDRRRSASRKFRPATGWQDLQEGEALLTSKRAVYVARYWSVARVRAITEESE